MSTTDNASRMIIKMLDEDPSKIMECLQDAEVMLKAGVDEGTSKAVMMAEYAVFIFRRVNPHLTEEAKAIDENYFTVEEPVVKYFQAKGY